MSETFKTRYQHPSFIAPPSAPDLRALQDKCAEIETIGGEIGAAASEIRGISTELSELTAYVDRVLANSGS